MKIINVKLGEAGQRAEREGWIIISYADPRGGRTSVGVVVKRPRWTADRGDGPKEEVGPAPTWEALALGLEEQMRANQSWPSFVTAKVSGNVVRMSAPDALDPSVFFAEFNPDLDQQAAHELNPPFIKIAEDVF